VRRKKKIFRVNATVYVFKFFCTFNRISTQLHNDLDEASTICYLESVPWYLKFYLHTLIIKTENGTTLGNILPFLIFHLFTFLFFFGEDPFRLSYQPSIDRKRPSVLELVLDLPPKTTVEIHWEFDKAFLKYTEHPPDANRGFDIGWVVHT
jgi:GPI-anchor transamidase subunit T